MSPLSGRLEALGVRGELMATWFASTLRDGFALTAAGAYADFATVAESAATSLLALEEGLRSPEVAARQLITGLAELPVHDDVSPALARLCQAGVRIATLTNGSRSNTVGLLERAGIAGLVEQNLSVDDVGRWKPAPEAYHYAVARCGVEPAQAMLVAVHPWDVDGAKRAGLAAAWINRRGQMYPQMLRSPDLVASNFIDLEEALLNGG